MHRGSGEDEVSRAATVVKKWELGGGSALEELGLDVVGQDGLLLWTVSNQSSRLRMLGKKTCWMFFSIMTRRCLRQGCWGNASKGFPEKLGEGKGRG